jgi:hypothetical protein
MADPWPDVKDFVPTGKKEDDDKKLEDFIVAMAKCWVETDKGKALSFLEKDKDWGDIKPKGADADAVADHLHVSYKRDVVDGFAKAKPPVKGPRLVQAWMVARIEEFRFHRAGMSRFGNLWPHIDKSPDNARDTADIPAAVQRDSAGYNKIAPGLATFLTALTKSSGDFEATNRKKGHSTVFYQNQGMSVDVYLPKKTSDGLWWDVGTAVKFLTAVDALAGTGDFKGTRWMALYNHFDVADQVNKKVKNGGIRFRGADVTYHGPDPALLHIHLEVVVPSDASWPPKS